MSDSDGSRERATDLEARLRKLMAETTGVEEGAWLDGGLDSLTLLALVARIEAAFAVSFASDEILALLGAPDSGALARLVARKIGAHNENLDEPAGNCGC